MPRQNYPLSVITGVFLGLVAVKFIPFMDLPFKGAYPAIWLFLIMMAARLWMLSFSFMLCALGDVMGILGNLPFQIIFFGLAQILFILQFWEIGERRQLERWRKNLLGLLWVVMLSVIIAVVLHIHSYILAFLVLFYGLLLLSMATAALLRSGPVGVAGALLFVLSDSMIGVRNFLMPFPYSGELIMGTYYAALMLLCIWFYLKYEQRDAVS